MKKVYRDATTGEFVTEEYADEHPDTTVAEEVQEPLDRDSLTQKVTQIMGTASVTLWSQKPRGIFQEDQALALVNEIMNAVDTYSPPVPSDGEECPECHAFALRPLIHPNAAEMNLPTNQWTCEACGRLINGKEHAS